MINKSTHQPKIIDFKQFGGSEIGYISVIENFELPFDVNRVYWTYKTSEKIKRGGHAHIYLEQVLIAISGTIEIALESKNYKKTFKISDPNKGLYVPKMYWRELKFLDNAILLSLASMKYDKEEYIRSYEKFKMMIS